MSNAWAPAATSNEGEVLNPSLTPVVREASLSSGEEEDSSNQISNDSTPKNTLQRRRSRTAWTEAAKLGLIQQVHIEKPYLVAHGQIRKTWENIASALSSMPPFAEVGGVRADACTQKYTAMLKDHREKVAKGEWQSGGREGESGAIDLLLNKCMAEEQEVLDEKEKKPSEGKGKQKEKDARSEKLLEASVVPAGSRSPVPGGNESKETSDEKVASSSSPSSPSLESAIAGYFASLSESPNTKQRKQEAQFLDANGNLDYSEIMRLTVASKQESPDSKRRRKDIEASDAAVRRLDAENRRLELEVRHEEVKATQALQQGTLQLIAKLVDKFSGEP